MATTQEVRNELVKREYAKAVTRAQLAGVSEAERVPEALSLFEDATPVQKPIYVDEALEESSNPAVYKRFNDQTLAEYLLDLVVIKTVLIPRYMGMYARGQDTTTIQRELRKVWDQVQVSNIKGNANALASFIRMVPEARQPDLIQATFDWRRKGETLRLKALDAKRKVVRDAAEAEQLLESTEAPSFKWDDVPTYEELGINVRSGGSWATTWAKRREQRCTSDGVPLIFGPAPKLVGSKPDRALRLREPGMEVHFKVQVYDRCVIEVQCRVDGNDGETVVDTIVLDDPQWKLGRVVGVLKSALRDPALGCDGWFPTELFEVANACEERATKPLAPEESDEDNPDVTSQGERECFALY